MELPPYDGDHAPSDDGSLPGLATVPSSSSDGFSDFQDADPGSKRTYDHVTEASSDDDAEQQASIIYSKRARHSTSPSSSSSDSMDMLSDSHDACSKQPHTSAKSGSSWAHQKALRDASKSSQFRASATKLHAFRDKILLDDPHAEFDDKRPLWVRCSTCSATVTMRALYDTLHWKNHRKTKKCQLQQRTKTRTTSLFRHGFLQRTSSTKSGAASSTSSLPRTSSPSFSSSRVSSPGLPQLYLNAPCPGLTSESFQKVHHYLSRTSAAGGGAPSRPRLAKELFGSTYSELNEKQKLMVRQRESQHYAWRNLHSLHTVYATNCLKDVDAALGQDPSPCSNCTALLSLHSFQVAVNRPIPNEVNAIFVPRIHRSEELGDLYLRHRGLRALVQADDSRSPWLRFAQGVISGDYDSQGVVLGMVEALVKRNERLKLGKSLKNMRYPEEFNEFCNILASTSPRAYRSFRQHFGGRGLRSLRFVLLSDPYPEPLLISMSTQ